MKRKEESGSREKGSQEEEEDPLIRNPCNEGADEEGVDEVRRTCNNQSAESRPEALFPPRPRT